MQGRLAAGVLVDMPDSEKRFRPELEVLRAVDGLDGVVVCLLAPVDDDDNDEASASVLTTLLVIGEGTFRDTLLDSGVAQGD